MNKKKTTDVWCDLIIALLSAYNIPLEKVDAMAPEFAKQGLTSPQKLSEMTHEEIHDALCESGYSRGKLNGIFIPRLQSLGQYATQKGLENCEKILKSSDKDKIKELLIPINGVGPKVVNTYLLLRGLVDA